MIAAAAVGEHSPKPAALALVLQVLLLPALQLVPLPELAMTAAAVAVRELFLTSAALARALALVPVLQTEPRALDVVRPETLRSRHHEERQFPPVVALAELMHSPRGHEEHCCAQVLRVHEKPWALSLRLFRRCGPLIPAQAAPPAVHAVHLV